MNINVLKQETISNVHLISVITCHCYYNKLKFTYMNMSFKCISYQIGFANHINLRTYVIKSICHV